MNLIINKVESVTWTLSVAPTSTTDTGIRTTYTYTGDKLTSATSGLTINFSISDETKYLNGFGIVVSNSVSSSNTISDSVQSITKTSIKISALKNTKSVTITPRVSSKTNTLLSESNSTIMGPLQLIDGANKASLLIGETADISVGSGSICSGKGCIASGINSIAVGLNSKALGDGSFAIGSECVAAYGSSHAEGLQTYADGTSHAEGIMTIATSNSSHAEGQQTKALSLASHSEGFNTIVKNTGNSGGHAEGYYTTAEGQGAHAEGDSTTAKAQGAHAEGKSTTASNIGSHSEGESSQAIGQNSHAEGYSTIASAPNSHAEGYQSKTLAEASYSHAEGMQTEAQGFGAHSEGIGSIAVDRAHAEGFYCFATGTPSHAEGGGCTASGNASHAEGGGTTASGENSHAEGNGCTASANSSHAEGSNTSSSNYAAHVGGKFNKALTTGGKSNNTVGDAFAIGNGTDSALASRSNCFRVTYTGATYGVGSFNTTGADYAEFFEWLDGNNGHEDRVGHFVTMEGGYIRYAEPGDYILGIVSGQPAIVGNSDEDWLGRWKHDEFGRFIKEYLETSYEEIDTSEMTEDELLELEMQEDVERRDDIYYRKTERIVDYETPSWRHKANPDYDPNTAYIERKDRPEWDYVGMMGVLSVYDNGQCQVNSFCQVGEGGIAVPADIWQSGLTYRVIERVTDNIIRVVLK